MIHNSSSQQCFLGTKCLYYMTRQYLFLLFLYCYFAFKFGINTVVGIIPVICYKWGCFQAVLMLLSPTVPTGSSTKATIMSSTISNHHAGYRNMAILFHSPPWTLLCWARWQAKQRWTSRWTCKPNRQLWVAGLCSTTLFVLTLWVLHQIFQNGFRTQNFKFNWHRFTGIKRFLWLFLPKKSVMVLTVWSLPESIHLPSQSQQWAPKHAQTLKNACWYKFVFTTQLKLSKFFWGYMLRTLSIFLQY